MPKKLLTEAEWGLIFEATDMLAQDVFDNDMHYTKRQREAKVARIEKLEKKLEDIKAKSSSYPRNWNVCEHGNCKNATFVSNGEYCVKHGGAQ